MPLIDVTQSQVNNQNQNTGNAGVSSQTGGPQGPQQSTGDIANNLADKLNQVSDAMQKNKTNTVTSLPQQQSQQPVNKQQPAAQASPTIVEADPSYSQSFGNAPGKQLPDPTKAGQLQEKEYALSDILNEAISKEASDVHLTTGYRAILRIEGNLTTLPSRVIDEAKMIDYAKQIVEHRKDIEFEKITEADLSYAYNERRFRVNIFKQQNKYAIVMRLVPKDIKTIDQLGLPQIFKEFAKVPSGLILVVGPTGSGKSTTLASVINHINTTQSKHIVTIEDPIEFVYPLKQSLIEQREFGIDFTSWPLALKSLLRQDPNVVLVGEMRDVETIASTITVSETGHLVFATLHTNSASQTIDRIIDVFPEEQQGQIRSQLANVLTAVISQRLVKLRSGGRKAVMELMVANSAVKNAIREAQTHQIDNMIQTGQDYGMMSMEKSLADLIKKGEISEEMGMQTTVKPRELEILLGKRQRGPQQR